MEVFKKEAETVLTLRVTDSHLPYWTTSHHKKPLPRELDIRH